jgi:hypothetical protein
MDASTSSLDESQIASMLQQARKSIKHDSLLATITLGIIQREGVRLELKVEVVEVVAVVEEVVKIMAHL